ncbi:MAG: permease-like protein [Frankiales bacterium]|nr:permease-like protein [Frankiales bacterium]
MSEESRHMSPDDSPVEDDPRVTTAEMQRVGVTEKTPFGRPGRPMDRRSPFYMGFVGAIGALLAIMLSRVITQVASVLILVLIAAFLAVGLDPMVRGLVKHGMRRGVAVSIVALCAVAFLGIFVAAIVPPVISQTTHFVQKVPDVINNLETSNSSFARTLRDNHIVERLKEYGTPDKMSAFGLKAVGGALGFGKVLASLIFTVLTVVILMLYFLANLPGIKRTAYRLMPASRRPRAQLLTEDILGRIGGYVLGNIITSIVAAVFSTIAFFIIGVPYPLPLGLLMGVLDLVPLVGATIAAVVAVVVASFGGLSTAVITLLVLLAYQQFENYILVPRVMKRAVDVPAAATVIAALFGAALLGMIGALIAVPAAAAIQLISREVFLPRQEAA